MGSRLTLVDPKRFADGLDLGYKKKRSQGFLSLNLLKGSRTNDINIQRKEIECHHVLGTFLHLTVTTVYGGAGDYYSHFTDKKTRCSRWLSNLDSHKNIKIPNILQVCCSQSLCGHAPNTHCTFTQK